VQRASRRFASRGGVHLEEDGDVLERRAVVSLLNARTSMLHAQALAEVQGRGRTVMQRPDGQDLLRGY
jgi:hypothetical protein